MFYTSLPLPYHQIMTRLPRYIFGGNLSVKKPSARPMRRNCCPRSALLFLFLPLQYDDDHMFSFSSFFSTTCTAVKRHCTDWYEICALTDHEIYYIKIELDLRKFSNGLFSETEKGFWVNPTPGGSQCTGLSPTLS